MISWLAFSLLLLYCQEFVHCEYDLQVTFYSFSNPNGKLIKRNRCCDDQGGRQCSEDVCDSFFSFCLRSVDEPVSRTDEDTNIEEICSNTTIISTPTMTDINSAMLFNSSYILIGSLMLQPIEIQFYLELLDHDSTKNDLIDRFAINISDSMNSFIERANYTGIFEVAMLEVSFFIINKRPTTESSPTVVTSTESSPTPEISPTVISTESGPTPEISPTVVTTGSPLEDNGYELLVTINSYRNPTHRCAGCNNCCDGACNIGCDTYFYLCIRPFKTSFSRNVQGNCPPDKMVMTESEKDRIDGTTFNDTVLGVANPINFSRIENPMEGVQLYLEMIDFDPNNEDDLIDRFIINITVPIGSSITELNITGIFGFAEISVSFEARCKSGYTCEAETELHDDDNDDDLLVLILIIGCVIFVILLVIVLIVVCIVIVTRRKKSKSRSSLLVNASSLNDPSPKGMNKESGTTELNSYMIFEASKEDKEDDNIEQDLKNDEYEIKLEQCD